MTEQGCLIALVLLLVCGCSGQIAVPPGRDGGPGDAGPVVFPSCAAQGPGAGHDCGVGHDHDCCESLVVPSGSFYRFYDGTPNYNQKSWPATISTFRLDTYEVTVGRFRAFVEAYPGSKPSPGDGAHANIAGSGWQPEWPLPADAAALRAELASPCTEGLTTPSTWTDVAGLNERMPMSCVTWYEAFAFCAWDGAWLPTDAQWNYAGSGGADQRFFPWSVPAGSMAVDESDAVFSGVPPLKTAPLEVGSKPDGQSRWGQLDLGGNLGEVVLDYYEPMPALGQCSDCAVLDPPSSPITDARAFHGGAFDANEAYLEVADRWFSKETDRASDIGVRCARVP